MPSGITKDGKPNSGAFVKGAADPRRNNAGQRNRAVVATASQARDLYVKVLHEPIGTAPDPAMSNLEMIVRQHIAAAKKGTTQDREQLLDRIWGKAVQAMELSGPSGGPVEVSTELTVAFNDEQFANVFAACIGANTADSAPEPVDTADADS